MARAADPPDTAAFHAFDFSFVIKTPGREWVLNPSTDERWRQWKKHLLKVVAPGAM